MTKYGKIYICSGEGERGSRQEFTGRRTLQALKRRQNSELKGGGRWCRIFVEVIGENYEMELDTETGVLTHF